MVRAGPERLPEARGVTVESPCIRVCTLDPGGELCLGCFRTLEEIGTWAQLSDGERTRVVERLPGRRREHESAHFNALAGAPERCERCGAGFTCGARESDRPCWCVTYPPMPPTGQGARCLCPACLAAATAT